MSLLIFCLFFDVLRGVMGYGIGKFEKMGMFGGLVLWTAVVCHTEASRTFIFTNAELQ